MRLTPNLPRPREIEADMKAPKRQAAPIAPDILKIAALERSIPALTAPGIDPIEPRDFPDALTIHSNVEMDEPEIFEAGPHDALGTSGVSSCYALGAVGRTLQGGTVLYLDHNSFAFQQPGGALEEMREAMAQHGVVDYRVYIAGGIVSRFLDAEGGTHPDSDSTVDTGEQLVRLAGSRLAAARIGLSEDGEGEATPDGAMLARAANLPRSVSVVLTRDGMMVCSDGMYGCRLGAMPPVGAGDSGEDESEPESAANPAAAASGGSGVRRPQLETLDLARGGLRQLGDELDPARVLVRRED